MHHQSEVVVSVDRAADAFIVIHELVEGHDTVGDLGIPLGHELLEDLIWSLLSFNDFWVLTCIVDLGNVLDCHLSILVNIKLLIG